MPPDQLEILKTEIQNAVEALVLACTTANQLGNKSVAKAIDMVMSKIVAIQTAPNPLKVPSKTYYELHAEFAVMLSGMEKAGTSIKNCVDDARALVLKRDATLF